MPLMPRLDEAKYKFCSTQINLNGTAATRVLMAADMLPDNVLGVEGREDQPHLTVQYGIQTPDVNAIRQAVSRVSPFEIVLGKTETFPATEHSSGDSPLFVSVKAGTDKLVALRNAIRAVVPVRDSFPTYVPHVCVAYVRTDAAQQYVGKEWLDGTVVVVNEIVFSNTEGEHVSIPLGRVSESTEDDSVCVMDFAGSYTSKKYGRIYPFNCWADWYPQKKAVVFGGAYADVPDMPATKEPTEAAVERWVKKHWKEDEWYPKYLKALDAAESSPIVGKINSLLYRLGEASDFSVYTDPEKFRVKFGDTSVADHNRIAADFKASAVKYKTDYEKRTGVKASGPSKYSNLRYYFDNAPEGKQYDALMTASRKHKKVADILTRGGRGSINESLTRDDAINAAARMTRKKYDATDFPSKVMSYDIARAGARDAGMKLTRNVDIDTRPNNAGSAILKMIDDMRVSKGGKRRHSDAYKPRRTVN